MHQTWRLRTTLLCAAALAVAGCEGNRLDWDMRRFGNGLDTSGAALAARTEERPDPDARGVISYPNYQVAVARPGDTVADVAARVGVRPMELARYNGIPQDAPLRPEEVLALPGRVAEPSPATGAVTTGPIMPSGGGVDVATIAGDAIDRAESARPGGQPAPVTGKEPVRHRVAEGETAFSIARRYGVSVEALAEWNGLGQDMAVRTGQYLLIPPVEETVVVAPAPAPTQPTSRPGRGTATPTPPSADDPLPAQDEPPAAEPTETPPAADLSSERTAASDTARFATPVAGQIIRSYEPGESEGIGIAAAAGTPVRAADAGTVAAITRDTEQVPIVVIRHEGDLLTVYAGVDDVAVEKGDQVDRGQIIAAIRAGNPAALHFEVRDGFNSVDPKDYLN